MFYMLNTSKVMLNEIIGWLYFEKEYKARKIVFLLNVFTVSALLLEVILYYYFFPSVRLIRQTLTK